MTTYDEDKRYRLTVKKAVRVIPGGTHVIRPGQTAEVTGKFLNELQERPDGDAIDQAIEI